VWHDALRLARLYDPHLLVCQTDAGLVQGPPPSRAEQVSSSPLDPARDLDSNFGYHPPTPSAPRTRGRYGHAAPDRHVRERWRASAPPRRNDRCPAALAAGLINEVMPDEKVPIERVRSVFFVFARRVGGPEAPRRVRRIPAQAAFFARRRWSNRGSPASGETRSR